MAFGGSFKRSKLGILLIITDTGIRIRNPLYIKLGLYLIILAYSVHHHIIISLFPM